VSNSTPRPADRHEHSVAEPTNRLPAIETATPASPTPPKRARRGRKKPNHQAAKPRKDFPLTAHPSGRWCKKVRGKLHYFGPLSDADAALNKWLAEKDYLLAGRKPPRRDEPAVPTLEDLVNRFLATKQTLLNSGDLSPWTMQSYDAACKRLLEAIGWNTPLTDIKPEHFEALRAKWAKTWGPVRIAAEVNRSRVILNYAYKNGMVDRPIRFGEGFRRPSKKTIRLSRHEQGPKMFEAAELCKMIAESSQPIKAMLLLAINGGLGNNDIAQMPIKALDLKTAWLRYPRPKTGIMRHVPLWPETVAAITDWLTMRPEPHSDAERDLVFLTRTGKNWQPNPRNREITAECRKLLGRLGINGNRNFYALRHTFETIAGESRDQIAVDAIMGHDDGSMRNAYRERISDERLKAVTEHLRRWLFSYVGPAEAAEQRGAR
jgi:integrase